MGDSSKKSKAKKPGFATLANLSDSADESEEQGQAFYAGGSERSGQQVLGPPRDNPARDYISEVFRSARQSEANDPHGHPTPNRVSSRLFVGAGHRLGQTEDDTEVLPGASASSGNDGHELVILKIWRQGFSINDGDLRPFDDPENKAFFESIIRGEIPAELRRQNMSMIHLDVEDHRHEEFKKPVKRFTAFTGEGQTLGSPVPNVTESAIAPELAKNYEEQAQTALNLNDSEPVTMLQIRLADGSRLTGRFNHSHTVGDIRRFIVAARPAYADQVFAVLSSFPPKELTEEDKSLKDAGLLNATIMQRLK